MDKHQGQRLSGIILIIIAAVMLFIGKVFFVPAIAVLTIGIVFFSISFDRK